jgi:hypothetical protein
MEEERIKNNEKKNNIKISKMYSYIKNQLLKKITCM